MSEGVHFRQPILHGGYMTATSVLTLTLYLAILLIVLVSAVGIRREHRPVPPLPPPLARSAPSVPQVRAESEHVPRPRRGQVRGPGRLARRAWRRSRSAARRTGTVTAAAIRATPELPAQARRLGRHAAGRAEIGRQRFDRGAVHHLPRLLRPVVRRLRPVRAWFERLAVVVLGPAQRGVARAAQALPQWAAGRVRKTGLYWQNGAETVRRRAARWRIPGPRRAPDLAAAVAADLPVAEPALPVLEPTTSAAEPVTPAALTTTPAEPATQSGRAEPRPAPSAAAVSAARLALAGQHRDQRARHQAARQAARHQADRHPGPPLDRDLHRATDPADRATDPADPATGPAEGTDRQIDLREYDLDQVGTPGAGGGAAR